MSGDVSVVHGDCVDVMAGMEPDSVDAVVCDPPYGIGFMGRDWDRYEQSAFAEWCQQWAVEALRVAKPGAHLVAFGGSRTHHRLMQGVEDAGWTVRDCGVWLYRSGFPKSLDVSKAIDKAAGAEREVVGFDAAKARPNKERYAKVPTGGGPVDNAGYRDNGATVTAPATDDAARWSGWGTALKPAVEPWVLARKPLSEGTVAANVFRWGTGALNIDGCRIGDEPRSKMVRTTTVVAAASMENPSTGATASGEVTTEGRWPANVVTLEDDPELRHFRVSGGQVADFAKASSAEKPWTGEGDDELHPTVKPLDMMRHLVRLVTPPGGLVLDPFAGTGTTGEAARLEGFSAILIEREPAYLPLIERRLSKPWAPSLFGDNA